ncbi:hypothetical protein CALCODRAFT_488881 [Calocera cornea HHB12733]|uniref:Uncharacterized protein n=1 Tax=Calocera cornea HHB12733 TaxID=1353952 RepID=A0A165C3Z8_9BASI|nr:hypothetical protein CALCODRAFT_488881 [Calocera cornea HHB12733]
MASITSSHTQYPPLDPAWFLEGGIAYLPNQVLSPLLDFDGIVSGKLQPICILDQWEPRDPDHPKEPMTPEDFWRRSLHHRTSLLLKGDIIPAPIDAVLVDHDTRPFLPPCLRRPPLASPKTWHPQRLQDRAFTWAYHGRIHASIETTSVALCGTGDDNDWLALYVPPLFQEHQELANTPVPALRPWHMRKVLRIFN